MVYQSSLASPFDSSSGPSSPHRSSGREDSTTTVVGRHGLTASAVSSRGGWPRASQPRPSGFHRSSCHALAWRRDSEPGHDDNQDSNNNGIPDGCETSDNAPNKDTNKNPLLLIRSHPQNPMMVTVKSTKRNVTAKQGIVLRFAFAGDVGLSA